MITEEIKQKNYVLYANRLIKLGLDVENLFAKYGTAILNGSFTTSNEFGNAYDGSLLEIVLKVLTPYAVKLNELLPKEQQVDKDTLVKICLLHHIGKAIKLVKNDNEWEVSKRNLVYKYNNELPSIRTGLLSLSMLQECGIKLTVDEIEALTVNDRDLTDEQSRWFSSVMATIIRQANELTYLEINKKK